MKTYILVEVKKDGDCFVGHTLWRESNFIGNVKIINCDKAKLIKLLKENLTSILETRGPEYIEAHSKGNNYVRCPEAKVVLPIDEFYCKHDKKSCHIGGGILINDKDYFIANCRFTERKEGIWNSIESNKYKGFHHIPGRYLCPSCETKNSEKMIRYNYHYPWELCNIGNYLDYKDIELRKKVIRNGINPNIYYSCYCGTCTLESLSKLNIENNFELLNLEVYRKK